MNKTSRHAYDVAKEMLDVEHLVACVPVDGGVYTFGGKINFEPINDSEIAALALAACVRARMKAEQVGLHPVE